MPSTVTGQRKDPPRNDALIQDFLMLVSRLTFPETLISSGTFSHAGTALLPALLFKRSRTAETESILLRLFSPRSVKMGARRHGASVRLRRVQPRCGAVGFRDEGVGSCSKQTEKNT